MKCNQQGTEQLRTQTMAYTHCGKTDHTHIMYNGPQRERMQTDLE